MKIIVDSEKCIGCGACAATCPQRFEMIDGKSSVKDDDVECDECSVVDIADACPSEAISIIEE
jgi:ferredoxin